MFDSFQNRFKRKQNDAARTFRSYDVNVELNRSSATFFLTRDLARVRGSSRVVLYAALQKRSGSGEVAAEPQKPNTVVLFSPTEVKIITGSHRTASPLHLRACPVPHAASPAVSAVTNSSRPRTLQPAWQKGTRVNNCLDRDRGSNPTTLTSNTRHVVCARALTRVQPWRFFPALCQHSRTSSAC